MRNLHLDTYTARDIDSQVTKILRDLGNPDPPLRLERVCELLKLAKNYYSTTDDGLLKRFVNSLRIAGKQMVGRPGFIIDFIRQFKLDALCLLDEKRILLSKDLPSAKQRWAEAHEIGHSIIPWHGPISHGDDNFTLSAICEEMMEAEANFAARRLLFLQDKFNQHALSSPPSINHILQLHKDFGNTITSTFYGLIELLDVPAFGLISQHPKQPKEDFDPEKPCRHFIRSPRFSVEYSHIGEKELFQLVQSYCGYGKWKLGESEEILVNLRGEAFIFQMETIFNHYDALTLGISIRRYNPLMTAKH